MGVHENLGGSSSWLCPRPPVFTFFEVYNVKGSGRRSPEFPSVFLNPRSPAVDLSSAHGCKKFSTDSAKGWRNCWGLPFFHREKWRLFETFYFRVPSKCLSKKKKQPPQKKNKCKKWFAFFCEKSSTWHSFCLWRCGVPWVGSDLKRSFFSTTPWGPSSWQRCNRLACGRASCASMRLTKQLIQLN